jgi:hypothetical protein
MELLLERKTYVCGATRAGRKDWPAEFRKPKQTETRGVEKATTRERNRSCVA